LNTWLSLARAAPPPENEASRERWLESALQRIPTGSRVLDAGAGTQRYRKFCGHLDYVSQDFGEYDGKGDLAGLQMGDFDYGKLDIVCDITSIPEPDGSFDAIMCVEVLEHLPDPVAALKELGRLTKAKGYLLITAPFCSLTHFAPFHFSTGFNRYWYEKHLGDSGFTIAEIAANGNFFDYLSQELLRLPAVSARYSDGKPHLLEAVCLRLLRHMLQRFSGRDKGSSELLCFGYHVLARKTTPPHDDAN
jgi:SAM-dependent methyltransferase